MTRTERILRILSDGPATSFEIAAELDMRLRDGVTALLNNMHKRGAIRKNRLRRGVVMRGPTVINVWSAQ